MIREIKKKKFLLDNRRPFSKAIDEYIKEVWLSEWIYTSNQLSGSDLTLKDSLTILKDQYLLDKTIEDHLNVRNHEEAISYVNKVIALGEGLSIKKIWTLHNILVLEEEDYRDNNPVLQHMQYVPPHFKDIPNLMEGLINWYHTQTKDMNPVLKGVLMHHKLIAIYPFNHYTEKTARALLNYELLKSGLPPVDFEMDDDRYFKLIARYLKSQDHSEFYEVICKKVYLRLELFLRLTDNEN